MNEIIRVWNDSQWLVAAAPALRAALSDTADLRQQLREARDNLDRAVFILEPDTGCSAGLTE